MDGASLDEVGIHSTPLTEVLRLSNLAKEAGLDGVVCSGEEVSAIRKAIDGPFTLVTPGIRLPGGDKNDQARIVTPEIAIQSGSDYLVVGRPITGAQDPIAAIIEFNRRIESVAG
jgi:orotidine-5'-phosphate decarboxylase